MEEYELGEPIGYGSFSTVYRALNRKTNKIFAIKLAKIEEDFEEETTITNANIDKVLKYDMKRIEKEIELWKPLDHDNLCRLLDVIVDEKEKKVAFIMEYAKDGDLLNLLSEKSLETEVIKEYFRQLCEAVNYLHGKLVIHGDIKLENILLNESKIKLSDFGLARRASNCGFVENCGTVEYAAPELLQTAVDSAECDPFKADIWALGVALYALIHRQFPFDGPTPKILKVRILTSEPAYPILEDEETEKLQKLVKKMLEKNWQRRPSIEEILNDLEH